MRSILIGIALLLAALTYARSAVWQSAESLWADAARKSPALARPHLSYGLELAKADKYDAALVQFRLARQASRNYRNDRQRRLSLASTRSNTAMVLIAMGQYGVAEVEADKALDTWPGLQQALINRGTARLAMGRCMEAGVDYLTAGLLELPKC